MRTPLTFVVRTFTLLLVISDTIESDHQKQRQNTSKQHNVLTVRRIKIRERSKSAVNTNATRVPRYQNTTFLDKLSPERRARCRRYAQQYYGQPVYPTIEFSQEYPDYSQYPYIQPQYVPYVPAKCFNYCLHCPTSSCRRRCSMLPNPSVPNQACDCDLNGSKYSSCDPTSGNCICKSHYEGRTCNVCKPGYWKTLKKDCIKCHCNEFGALDSTCNQDNGQCNCKPGVTGQNCDQCLPNYYGTVETGCIECELCNKKGHICGKGGKCVCPTLTIGKQCDRCALNSWGYEFQIGCRACNCSHTGSATLQCDKISGSCSCKSGYEGGKCDRCAFGYYGYPNCRKCLCNSIGTLETECQNGDCQCNEDGTCNCKQNVIGSKCNTCKNGTFGLSKDNPRGCKQCFCFGRSSQCLDTKYNWDKIRFEKFENGIENNEPISSDTISLPKQFMGDLTTSYDGYLSVNGSGGRFNVFLTGNEISLNSEISTNELKLNERHWRVTSGNIPRTCQISLNRECFLLVLQNVTSIVIQGQDMEILEVLLDSARPYIPYNRTSHSIEKCDCTEEYTGLSCQDPNRGFYRHFPSEYEVTQTPWIDKVIGVAKPCNCNGRSAECDADTGYCQNCSNNTAGFHCELCDIGYYQDYSGNCQPCLCPNEFDNNAETCVAKKYGFVCQCKKGYIGTKCEFCKDSYFRDPDTNKCVPCNCNYYGSYSSTCNSNGKCDCRSGFEGDKCNQCKSPREYIKDGICTPCDECTQLLFHDIDRLYNSLDAVVDIFKDGLSPPWKVLDTLRVRYKMLNKTYHYKHDRANHILKIGDISSLEDTVYNMADRVDVLGKTCNESIKNTENQLKDVTSFLQELKNLNNDITDLIKKLKNFGKKHVDVESALENANRILNEIKTTITQRIADVEAYNQLIFGYCEKVSERVNDIFDREPPELPFNVLNELNEKLDEIDLINRQIEENTANAEIQNDQNSIAISGLETTLKLLGNMTANNEESIKEVSAKLKLVKDKLEELRKVVEGMEKFDFIEFDRLKGILQQFNEEGPELEDLVHRASKHVAQLKKMVDDRVAMLNFTEDETKKIKTSGAYNELIEGVAEARKTANEAKYVLQQALDLIHPEGSDGLGDRANLAHTKSDRLKYRISNMKNISNRFNALKNEVESLKDSLIDSGRFNNDLSRQLLNLEDQITSKGELVKKLHKTIDDSSKIIDKMRKIEKDISELNITIRYDLFNEKSGYTNRTSEAEKAIQNARDSVNEAMRKVNQLLESNQEIDDGGIKQRQLKIDNMTARIAELQSKITYARQAAESVNVAMGLSNCSMLYSIPQAEVFRSLAVTFKCANCQLFKWNSGGLSITIKNGKAILGYTVDDQADEISTDKEGGSKMEKTLFVQRTGSLLQMKFDNDSTWKKAQIGNKVLVIDPSDRFQIGDGLPAQNNAYIYKFSINDNNIGLWKFAETSGRCKGQARVDSTELKGANSYYSGNGYKKYETAPLSPAKFNLPFYFATFDENSLIYLAQEIEHPSAYISLTIEDGYLKFDVHHNNNQTITLKSKEKFNNGKLYYVDLVMAYSNKVQQYSLETEKDKDSTRVHLDNKAVFRIKKAIHFVGGLPPTLDANLINVNKRSFLGFLNPRAQLSNELISSGVTQKIGELELEKAWFNGNGTLHLSTSLPPSETTQKLNAISFILRPLIANAAIMDIQDFGTITLSNRLLQINLINGEHYLADQKMALDINDYNVISIRFKNDMISLTVNDEDENIYRTKADDIMKGDAIAITIGSIEEFTSFYGGISDIIINNENLLFSAKTVTFFSNVEIGREPPLTRFTITLKGLENSGFVNMTNTMQNTEGCATTANYATDPTAVNFGDQADSYIKIKTPFWKKDFKFEFDFRTLYPSGMLFISVGSTTPSQYNFLELKDGMITLHVKGKRKIPKNWPITFSKKVSDGEWHTVRMIKKNGKKLQMWLDGEAKKPVRIPRTAVKPEIFLGNTPTDYIAYKELKERIRPFRGCINNLKINEEQKLLGKNTNDVVYNNIRQCFPKIEEGAYFGGDAYAIYKEGFRINKILEFSFEFRTAEQNGILLTVSNEGNYPALSVELQNGAVVMTVDLGNGLQSNVTNNLDSDFALCNNMWHNVTAMYSSSELTVNVNGIRKSWVQSDVNSFMDEIDAPLYIGGLPDNAAVGTLKTRENLKGCIRNLKIENVLKDWSEMEELNGVLLNSCPVVSNAKS